MTLRFRPVGTDSDINLGAPRLIIAAYTGRNAAAVAAHIEELAAIGIPPPASVPAFFELDPGLVTSDPVVTITGSNTSGEVEPVVIRRNGVSTSALAQTTRIATWSGATSPPQRPHVPNPSATR
jgi:hypothetical protein